MVLVWVECDWVGGDCCLGFVLVVLLVCVF